MFLPQFIIGLVTFTAVKHFVLTTLKLVYSHFPQNINLIDLLLAITNFILRWTFSMYSPPIVNLFLC